MWFIIVLVILALIVLSMIGPWGWAGIILLCLFIIGGGFDDSRHEKKAKEAAVQQAAKAGASP